MLYSAFDTSQYHLLDNMPVQQLVLCLIMFANRINRNGELKEYIVSGVTKEDFVKRLSLALGGAASQPPTSTNAQPTIQPSSSSSNSTPTQQSAAIQTMLAERRAKLEIHKKEQEAAEKAKREAASAARKEAAAADPNSKAGNERNYANIQKKRQQDAREERARILKRVEDDKTERREREAERKAQTAAAKEAEKKLEESTALKSTSQRSKSECALQVRLFDGTTIRSRFPVAGSLRRDVRPWIDEHQEGDAPYTFKLVLTPLPNKNVETSEEEQSLVALGLTPSATLILLPVTDFASAYEGKGVLGRGYGLVSSGLGAVGGLLGSVLGSGAAAPAPAQAQESGNTTAGPSSANSAKVRTLRDQEEKKDDRQFYNGNAVSCAI